MTHIDILRKGMLYRGDEHTQKDGKTEPKVKLPNKVLNFSIPSEERSEVENCNGLINSLRQLNSQDDQVKLQTIDATEQQRPQRQSPNYSFPAITTGLSRNQMVSEQTD